MTPARKRRPTLHRLAPKRKSSKDAHRALLKARAAKAAKLEAALADDTGAAP